MQGKTDIVSAMNMASLLFNLNFSKNCNQMVLVFLGSSIRNSLHKLIDVLN